MKHNKLWIIVLLFMIGFLIQAYDAHGYCCVDYLGEMCTDNPVAGCAPPSVSFSESCAIINAAQCVDGCCCLSSTGGQLTWNLSCQNFGGTFYSYPTTLSECNTFCFGVPLTKHLLHGYVRNDTSYVPNASVTLINRNNANVNTSADGYYTFSNVEAGDSLTVLAQKGECSWEGAVTPFNQDTGLNILLDCCEYSCEFGECINGFRNRTCYAEDTELCAVDEYTESNIACTVDLCNWDCTEWDPPFTDPNNLEEPCPAGYTQRERDCSPIIVGNCVEGTTPDLLIECESTLSSCGNGVIEGGEECDFLSGPPFDGVSNCPVPYNTYEWCDACECVPPTITGDCNLENLIYPTTVNAKGVYSQRVVNVSWALPEYCANYVSSYEVFGCRNTTSCPFINVSGLLSKNVDRFMVLNTSWFELIAKEFYCFKLKTTFNSSLNGLTFMSDPDCMQMGDDVCLAEHDDQWCEYVGGSSAILSCNPDNEVVEQFCTSGTYCGVYNGVPKCLMVDDCEKCNGLFGIFGYQGFVIDYYGELTCPTLNNRIATKDGKFAGCFLDYSNTSVDKVYNCSIVRSCYDYKSRISCEQDYCGTFRANVYDNKCEWQYYSEVFNKGVCRPKKEYVDAGLAIQNCSLCNDPLYNRMYGACTEDTCSLYGYCYFKSSTGKCIDGYSVSCSDYDNQIDCNGGSNVLVDTRWNLLLPQKIGGTNRVLENSSDELGILRCEWNGTKCFRNADNLSNTFGDAGIDCRMVDLAGNYNKTLCEMDITAPLTTISPREYYGKVMDLTDAISTSDSDSWPLGDTYSDTLLNRKHVWIYYGISDKFKYPTKILRITSPIAEQNYRINLLDEIPDGLEQTGQELTFFYFAEDPARNLEMIKSFNFILDISNPVVSLNTRLESYNGEFEWGDWATNLFVDITLRNEISLPVECFYNITPILDYGRWNDKLEASNLPLYIPPQNNIIDTVPGELHTTYFELWPDRYNYEFKCIDDVGNYHAESGSFTLDGDLTISDPSPIDTTYTTAGLPDEISIHTTADGTCRYSMTKTDYYEMEGRYSKSIIATGDYLHYDPIINVFPELELVRGIVPSKIYKIYTACDLIINGQHKIITGGVPDIIRFAVDDLPPVTRLQYDVDGELKNFSNNESMDTLQLYLNNDDYSPLLDEVMDDGIDMSFGPNKTYYCINTSFGICNIVEFDLNPITKEPILFDYKRTDAESDYAIYGTHPEFCYYSIDNGMNQEQERCITLNVTNKYFEAPSIKIYVP